MKTIIAGFLIVGVCSLFGCREERSKKIESPPNSGSYVTRRTFPDSDLTLLSYKTEIELSDNTESFLIGDVVGTNAEELIVIEDSSVTIFNGNGNRIAEVTPHKVDVRLGFLFDIDGDKKKDIVLGGKNESSGRLLVVNGKGSVLIDASFEKMIDGNTYPQFFLDDCIYFTAYSRLRIAPKVVGAFNVVENTISWSHHMGPVPLSLSLSADSGRIAVSHRALGKEREEVKTEYTSAYNRHAMYVLDKAGEEDLYKPFGPPTKVGYFKKDQISGVTQKLFDVDRDGTEEILLLIERASELYDGPAMFRICDMQGNILTEIEGPTRSEGSFGFFFNGQTNRIVLVWQRSGEVLMLDEALHEIGSTVLPGAVHAAKVQQIGDFDGDGYGELLLTDDNRFFILDQELRKIYGGAVRGKIKQAEICKDETGNPLLTVLADNLSLFTVGNEKTATLQLHTFPACAKIYLDDRPVDPLELPVLHNVNVGKHTVQAFIGGHESDKQRIDLSPASYTQMTIELNDYPVEDAFERLDLGQERRIPLSIPPIPKTDYNDFILQTEGSIPSGFSLFAVADVGGDERKDILLYNREKAVIRAYNADLDPLFRRKYTGNLRLFFLYGDLNGDGKIDVGSNYGVNTTALYGYTADGKRLFDKCFTYGYDTTVEFGSWAGNDMTFVVNTGYLLTPRGIYSVNPADVTINFFFPIAGLVNKTVCVDDKIFCNYYTPHNGAGVTYEDGTVDNDSELFLHVIDESGRKHPYAKPLPGDDVDGAVHYFLFDANDDGENELYFTVNKDEYYNGLPKIYRWNKDGSLSLCHKGPRDSNPNRLRILETEDGRHLAILWRFIHRLDMFDGDFNIIYSRTFEHPREVGRFINLDGGDWEFMVREDDGIRFLTLERERIASFSMEQDTLRNVTVEDIDNDGRFELIALGDHSIEIWE